MENTMTPFLSPDKQKDLIEKLVDLGMDLGNAKKFAEIEDDMAEVDLAMTAHVMCVVHFRETASPEAAIEGSKGIICLAALMHEAMDRGLGEDDFPTALEAIKNDLNSRGITVVQ
jgi:hypothetical protein